MISIDLVTMIINLSASMASVARLITAFAYILGIIFFITGLKKLHGMQGQSAGYLKPIAYLFTGVACVFLPSAMTALSNSTFGAHYNLLQYAPVYQPNIIEAMDMIIRVVGILWFLRGIVLMMHASSPGTKDKPKGMVFMMAGIFAMNFQATVATLSNLLGELSNFSITVKNLFGY